MITYQPEEIETIEFELRNNKAAIIDTDTVMGIVSFDMKNIYKIKNRPHSKKLVVFLKDFENEEIFNDAEIKILKKY
ncbi:MAG: hypothetical protein K2M43_00850 [Mycoplasmoidaceae bacterium]|nr:hypothetical protein [Mycoplasmoidaceae bacterium]